MAAFSTQCSGIDCTVLLKLSAAVFSTLKLQHSKVISGSHHVDQLVEEKRITWSETTSWRRGSRTQNLPKLLLTDPALVVNQIKLSCALPETERLEQRLGKMCM